jgi:DNA replication protein DnaC
MTVTIKKLSLQKNYEISRNDILSKIINNDNPKSEIDIQRPFLRSTLTLGDYVTLDYKHKIDINRMKQRIRDYALDKTRRRPLNFIMIAQPGSGKSHFIKCLAKSMYRDDISAVNFNMANKSSIDDLTQPLEAVRNLKVTDRTPILFLDEFDSSTSNYSLLLPLLWDGEFHIGHHYCPE